MWGATVGSFVDACFSGISIHAPRVGSDPGRPAISQPAAVFQSTLPVWGATSRYEYLDMIEAISIHAPRVGSDTEALRMDQLAVLFQSTLPVWGATLMVPLLSRMY